MEKTIYEAIKNYTDTNAIPMHMPGHKRSKELQLPLPYDIDITEIDGFDNLHNMEGLLLERSEVASSIYKTLKSYFLINGSTGGILSAIYSQTQPHDKIIVARNSHKSVFNACEINQLEVIYAMPTFDSELQINGQIEASEIEKLLCENTSVKCVVITSPTYEGITSDIEAIAKICHNHNALLIVDEAHGAHFGFDNHFPKSAREQGADIVINSLHKTLPALTQCAIAHICTDRVNTKKFEKALSIFETSSPSYILMSSIDYCIQLLKTSATALFENYNKNLDKFYSETSNLKHLKVANLKKGGLAHDYDKGKIIISTKGTNINGTTLAQILRKSHNIEIEMSSTSYVIAMTSICDSEKNFTALANALYDIDNTLQDKQQNQQKNEASKFGKPQKKYDIYEMREKERVLTSIENCTGKICSEFIWAYPPGIPIVVSGEILSVEVLNQLKVLSESGLAIKSESGQAPNLIYILK